MTATETPVRRTSALWAPDRRGPTIGIVLLVTLAAFEDMGVNTAMPRIVGDLHGGAWYAWPFVAFLAASVVACVLSGRICDLRGPVPSMIAGPAVFVVGLVVSGTAVSMPLLLLGRTLQGLGAGAQVVAVTVLIGAVYPERDRPAAYGALSAAWVLPALIGPAVAGVVTQQAGWRPVFLGLVPLVLLGLAILVPVLRRLPAEERDGATPVRRGLPLAALGAAVGLSALTFAAQHPSAVTLVVGVVALGALVPSARRLLPAGTLRARPGLPTAILSRGLLSGGYFAVLAYVPLTLTAVHHYPPAAAGLPLTVGALGWCLASAWQGRRRDLSRTVLLRAGFVLLAVGLAGVALIAAPGGPAWAALVVLPIAGAGMGLGVSSASVLTLDASTVADRGFNSSAMQISDLLGQVLMVGVGGVLVNLLASTAHPTAAVLPLDLAMAALAALGAVLAGRRTGAPALA
ncbi:MFS transporter [Actinocatenispora rupis]|uniref:MFS transporter n=1 Tax=Actinocatenispora rupis TaxID=519421 RepID=A0A8J3NE96_9ACTN|nr:MFS transporter [Actinocatenispora rupis]GID15786.1 MFS transporter [Actinocatenispora rupis]